MVSVNTFILNWQWKACLGTFTEEKVIFVLEERNLRRRKNKYIILN
jgi:hypothetical protein